MGKSARKGDTGDAPAAAGASASKRSVSSTATKNGGSSTKSKGKSRGTKTRNNESLPTYVTEDRIKGTKRGILVNRIFILLVLSAACAVSWYYQTEVVRLNHRVQSDQQTISTLQTMVVQHNNFLKNFNASVSNANVVAQLKLLGLQVNGSQQLVQMELNATRTAIQAQLAGTEVQLNQTVAAAKQQIATQVDNVKKQLSGYISATQSQLSMQSSFMIFQLAGTFALLACLISMWHMTAHLRKFHKPRIQRKILAILWMVPIYAITSWLSLVFPSAEGYLNIVKDFYEAYIIYQFLSFCIAVLAQGDRSRVVEILTEHADHLSPPFRFDALCNHDPYPTDRALAEAVLMECQVFAMQFVFFRPLSAVALLICKHLNYTKLNLYFTIIQNVSIFMAFAGLLKFYHAVDKELSWCKPFAKFLCIKGVVFMTFWQGLAITILASTRHNAQSRTQWAASAQNFLVCLEMLLFSIAHYYTYPPDEWTENYQDKMKQRQRIDRHFGDSLALNDFLSDLKLIIRGSASAGLKKKKLKAKKKKKKLIETVAEHHNEDDYDDDDDDDDDISAATMTSLSSDASLDDAALVTVTERLLSHRFLNYRDDMMDDGNDSYRPLSRSGGTSHTLGANRVAEIMRRHSKIEPPKTLQESADSMERGQGISGSGNTLQESIPNSTNDGYSQGEDDNDNGLLSSRPPPPSHPPPPPPTAGRSLLDPHPEVDDEDDLENGEGQPTERTSLLGSSSSPQSTYSDEAGTELRPSFFTSVGSMGNNGAREKKDT